MRANGYRSRQQEYIIMVMFCALHGKLTTSFMHLSNSAGQSVWQKRLIWSGSDANSEGIYNFIVEIKYLPVADCLGVQVPYLSTTRRDVPKEWCLACLLLFVFCHQEPHRCHREIRLLRGHGSSIGVFPRISLDILDQKCARFWASEEYHSSGAWITFFSKNYISDHAGDS